VVVAIGLGVGGLALRASRRTSAPSAPRDGADVRAQPIPSAQAATPAEVQRTPRATSAPHEARDAGQEAMATVRDAKASPRDGRSGGREERASAAELELKGSARDAKPSAIDPRPAARPQPSAIDPRPAARPQPSPVLARVRAQLAALQASPGDYALAEELRRALVAAAEPLPDADARTAIRRCAASGMLPVDVAVLGACVDELATRLP
jgi:hypothetical protein